VETKLTSILDALSLEEVNQLLEGDMRFVVDAKVASRIKSSVFRKIGIKKNNVRRLYSKNLMVASLVVCMLMLTGFAKGYQYYQTPVSYLDVDINPSIELGINGWNRIISADGYNGQGERILEITNVLNKEVETGVKDIVEAADEQGFFAKEGGGAVALTSLVDDREEAKELTDNSKKAIEEYTSEHEIDIEVVTEHVALERRDKAKEIGLSAGKLNLIQKLQALDAKVAVEEYKDVSVKEIMKSIRELKKIEKETLQIDHPEQADNEVKQNNMPDKKMDNEKDDETNDKSDIKIKDKEDDKTNDRLETKIKDKVIDKTTDKTNSKEGHKTEGKQNDKIDDEQDNKVNHKQNNKLHNKKKRQINNMSDVKTLKK